MLYSLQFFVAYAEPSGLEWMWMQARTHESIAFESNICFWIKNVLHACVRVSVLFHFGFVLNLNVAHECLYYW